MKLGVKFSNPTDVVYSTEHGQMCPACGKPKNKCACSKSKHVILPTDGIVRLHRETSGRNGKCVTVITGLELDAEKTKQLATQLKKMCGTGGTAKNGVIEIQGDHRKLLLAEFVKRGMVAKIAGG